MCQRTDTFSYTMTNVISILRINVFKQLVLRSKNSNKVDLLKDVHFDMSFVDSEFASVENAFDAVQVTSLADKRELADKNLNVIT